MTLPTREAAGDDAAAEPNSAHHASSSSSSAAAATASIVVPGAESAADRIRDTIATIADADNEVCFIFSALACVHIYSV
jgi:hypothetical protein